MPATRTYTADQGDAWDLIAKRELGSEGLLHELMNANPELRAVHIFPAGVELAIPDVGPLIKETVKPPWQER